MDPEAFVYMALTSEAACGPGAVMVDAEACKATYTALRDIEPAAMRERMDEQINSQPDHVYVITRTSKHMHVFSYPRERALQKLKSGTLPLQES